MSTKTNVQEYLLKHPIDRSQPAPYSLAARALGVDTETIRSEWRRLRRAGLVEVGVTPTSTHYVQNTAVSAPSFTTTVTATDTYKVQGDQAVVTKQSEREIKNELDLADHCDIDLSTWTISEWECKAYNAWIKNKEGEIEQKPMYSVYAKMRRKKVDQDPSLQKEVLLRELFDSAPELQIFEAYPEDDCTPVKDTLYELSLPDIHFGKLAWGEETGEDYDLKIAEARYRDAIDELLARPNLERIERIVFPIGNDMINVDNNNNTTTAGTPQGVDGRFPKIIRIVKRILVEQITRLATIAPVDVIVVPGNHDNHTMFMIGEILEAYFHKTERVSIDNSPAPRKYYEYGVCGFQYAHGDNEKHQELGLIFATEQPELWARTKFRVAKLGHLHKTKKLHYLDVDEHQGFQVEILPSLSGTDLWHKKNGYMSNKAAKSFIYHKEKGKLAEFTYTLMKS